MLKKVLCVSASAGLLFISGCFSGVNSSGGGSSLLDLVVPNGAKNVKLNFEYKIDEATPNKDAPVKTTENEKKADTATKEKKVETSASNEATDCKVNPIEIAEVKKGETPSLQATIKNVCLDKKGAEYTAILSLETAVSKDPSRQEFKQYSGSASFSAKNKENGQIKLKIILTAKDGTQQEVDTKKDKEDVNDVNLIVEAELAKDKDSAETENPAVESTDKTE